MLTIIIPATPSESFPILERARLPKIRLYDLRHTAATLAVAAGVPVKVVSEQLGHSNIAFTLDVSTSTPSSVFLTVSSLHTRTPPRYEPYAWIFGIEKARGRSLADALRGESETMSAADKITVEAQKNINRIQLALLHEPLRTTFFVTVKNLLDRTYIVDRARGILPSSPRLLQGGMKIRF